MMPSIVTKYFEKRCLIETEGKYARGLVVIDWWGKLKTEDQRPFVKIVTGINLDEMVRLLIQSVNE